jgi:hypothetical protein
MAPRRRHRPPQAPAVTPHPPSRRDFLRALGAAGALPFVGALPVAAESPPPAAAPPAANPEAAEDIDVADARSLGEIVQRRYGARLSEAQMYDIRKDIEGSLEAGRTLRALPLQNHDEPVTRFRALPPEA